MRLATREPAKIVALLAVFLMLVLAVSSCTFRLTPIDKPNGLTCGSPLVEVAAYTPRAGGTLTESHVFGCTLYFYETPALPTEHERKGGELKPPPPQGVANETQVGTRTGRAGSLSPPASMNIPYV